MFLKIHMKKKFSIYSALMRGVVLDFGSVKVKMYVYLYLEEVHVNVLL